MKTSYFNPEVHSFPFMNSGYVLCGVTYYQCGGICCTALDRFYRGELISCESSMSNFGSDITSKQVGIIGSDPMKSCDFGEVSTAIPRIEYNISYGKPTLLYLDLEWGYLDDHFVIAYAIDKIYPDIVKVYIYDPNWVYKRHYCDDHKGSFCIDPAYPKRTLKNFESYLEVNYKTKKVTLFNGTDERNVPGFKWYGLGQTVISTPVSSYTGETNVGHSCDIALYTENKPEIIKNSRVISHQIKISKNGTLAADLNLRFLDGKELYESGDILFPDNLKKLFSPAVKHTGLQVGSGKFEKIFTVYQNYAPSETATIILQSNFIEKSLQLAFPKPEIDTFSAYIEGSKYTRKKYSAASVNKQLINIQGLDKNNIVEVERIPDNYRGPLPASLALVYYNDDDLKEIIKYDAFTKYPNNIFYLGYIKSNVVIEIMHNGLYTNANAVMTPVGQASVNKKFDAGALTFTLKGGNKALYDANASQTINFKISGSGESSEFTESFSVVLQYRCLIQHIPDMMKKPDLTVRRKPFIEDFDNFTRYFAKLLINNPHTSRIPELENRFNLELAKHPGIDKEGFKELFGKQLIKRFTDESKTFRKNKVLYRNFIDSYNTYEAYRDERTNFILTRSKNFQELQRNFEILEGQMRPLIGRALVDKKTFKDVLTNVLNREWE